MNDLAYTPPQLGAIEDAITRLSWVASARLEAIEFVIDVHGDLVKITDELERRKQIIAFFNEEAALAPGASPRIWLDSYLATLQDCQQLITSLEASGEQWDLKVEPAPHPGG